MSYRISVTEKDLSSFVSAQTNETGAMVLLSKKGPNTPVQCQTVDDVFKYAGYPSSTYPSVFEAVSFVQQAPLYISCPYGATSKWGGVHVMSGSVEAFSAGQDDPDNFAYTTANVGATHSFGSGDGVTTAFSDTLSNTKVDEGSLRVKIGSTTMDADDESNSITGDAVSAGTIDYDTGAISFTFNTAPASGQAVTVDYGYESDLSATVSHSFFTASPYADDLAVDIKAVTGTQFLMTLYQKIGTNYSAISGYEEVTYSLTKEKDGYGKSIYIFDVFDDDPYLIPKVNTSYPTPVTYSFTETQVDFDGGNRITASGAEITTAWAEFQKRSKYPVYLIMDVIGGYYTTVNNLIVNGYQPYAHALTPIPLGTSVADAVTYRSSMSVDSDNLSIYYNWSRIEDPYNNSYAWISNIGSMGKKFAMMEDLYDSGSPAGIDEDGTYGGQLSDWAYKEVEYDVSEIDKRTLNEAQINPIIFDEVYGVMAIGDKTAQVTNSDTSFIGHRRAFNFLLDTVEKQVLKKQVFKDNDEEHRTRVRVQIDDFITSTLGAVGAFREWYVQVDEKNNNDIILAQRKFVCDIFVKVQPNSQFVTLKLTKMAQNQVVSELLEG